jgi:hypothetical protein
MTNEKINSEENNLHFSLNKINFFFILFINSTKAIQHDENDLKMRININILILFLVFKKTFYCI